MSSPANTLSAGSVNLILYATRLEDAGIAGLLQTAGIAPTALRSPDGRVPLHQVQTLWKAAIEATGDPDLPLRLGSRINPLAMGVLAYVMLNCPTLGVALSKLTHYQDVACEGVLTAGRLEGDAFILSLRIISPDIRYPRYVLDSELSVYMAAVQALTGKGVVPREVRFELPEPEELRCYREVFGGCALAFNAPETALVLDAALLDAPILNANPGLLAFFEERAGLLLSQLAPAPSTSDRVRREIARLLRGEAPTLPAVADSLATGVRALQLHLRTEGTNYQQLLDETRHTLALRHLREPHLSITDIAYLLGFSEPGALVRAFKKWTGQTPGEYRKQPEE